MSSRCNLTGASQAETVGPRLSNKPAPLRRNVLGFTLVEVMVVVALMALILTLAAPSFTRLYNAAAISSGVNQFLADMRFARSEALRRGGGVVLCRSEDPESPSAACAAGEGTQGWASGWIVFHDLDGNGARNGPEYLLRVQARNPGIQAIAAGGTPTIFRFGATGRLVAPGAVASLHFGGAELDASIRRVVCVSPGGRARIAGDGTASCGANG